MATADSQAFTLQVNSPATFPLWDTVIPTQNLVVGTPFSLDLDSVCTDAAGLFSTYSLVSGALPAGLTMSGTRNRIVSGTPTAAGNVNSTLRANDGVVNVAPVWAITPTPSFTQGTAAFHPASGTYQTNSYVTDADGDPITISKNAAALPPGVTFTSGASARFSYNGTSPVASTSGHILTANDGQGHTVAGTSFGVSIVAPAFPAWDAVIPTQNLVVGVPFSLDLDTVCTDGPSLLSTYSLVSGSLPAGLTLSGTRNRILSGTPTTAGTSTPTFRANDGVANSAPTWNSTPSPTFSLGVAATHPASGTYQSTGVVTDADGDPITVTKNTVALPSSITFTPGASAKFNYTGGGSVGTTSGHVLTADDGQGHAIAGGMFSVAISSASVAEADWIARSTLSGVTFANDFRVSLLSQGGFIFADGLNPVVLARVVRDTTDGPTGQCCRIDIPADGPLGTSAALVLPMNSAWTVYTQGIGTTETYIQFRFKIPASRLVRPTNADGWKWLTVGAWDPVDPGGHARSHINCTHVLQDSYMRNMPQGYNYGPGGLLYPWEEFFGQQIKMQNAVDHGASVTPDTARYCLFNTSPGCWFWPTDEWLTCMLRIKVNQYNSMTGVEHDVWFARQNATAWEPITRFRNWPVGDPEEFTGGLGGLHFSAYETGGHAGGPATNHKYAQVIVRQGAPIPLPGVGA